MSLFLLEFCLNLQISKLFDTIFQHVNSNNSIELLESFKRIMNLKMLNVCNEESSTSISNLNGLFLVKVNYDQNDLLKSTSVIIQSWHLKIVFTYIFIILLLT